MSIKSISIEQDEDRWKYIIRYENGFTRDIGLFDTLGETIEDMLRVTDYEDMD